MKKKNESFSDLFDRLSKTNIEALEKLKGSVKLKHKKSMIKDVYKKHFQNIPELSLF